MVTLNLHLQQVNWVCQYCCSFAQVFDGVWHAGLLLPQNVCALLRSYLVDRNFFVMYGMHCSSTRLVTAGVPQVSVLRFQNLQRQSRQLSRVILRFFLSLMIILRQWIIYNARWKWFLWVELCWKIQVSGEKSVNITFTLCPHLPQWWAHSLLIDSHVCGRSFWWTPYICTPCGY